MSAVVVLTVAAGCGGGSASDSGSGDFTVTAGAASINVPQAKSATLQISISPINGFSGAVNVTASGLPGSVSAATLSLPAGTLTGTLTVLATSSALQGDSTSATITATAANDPTLTHAINATVTVIGAPGDLVDAFGNSTPPNGLYGYSFAESSGVFAMGFQPGTDELLVAGNGFDSTLNAFAVSLIDPAAGAPDPGFGGSGTVLIGFGAGTNAYARSMAISPFGAVALAGYIFDGTTSSLAVVLLTSNGALAVNPTVTTTFGTGGAVTGISSVADTSQFSAITFQTNGDLVVAANSDTSGTTQLVVTRLLPSGLFDTSFNTTGQLAIAVGGTVAQARAITLDANQNILVCGQGGAANTAFVARIVAATGKLDTTFASGTGIALVPFGAGANFCNSVLSTPDGIVVAGGNTASNSASIARLNATGSALDATFGTNGIETVAYGAGTSYITQLVQAGDGSFYASVFGLGGNEASQLFLSHYLANGTLDTAFGNGAGVTNEYVANNANTGNDLAQAVAVDPISGFVFQGASIPDPVDAYQDWAVLAYWP